MPSLGFLVISFVAFLLVLTPSAIFFIFGWRKGKYLRVFSSAALLVFLLLAWALFTDPESTDFEARAVLLYGVWSVVFYLGAAVFVSLKAIFRLTHWPRHGK